MPIVIIFIVIIAFIVIIIIVIIAIIVILVIIVFIVIIAVIAVIAVIVFIVIIVIIVIMFIEESSKQLSPSQTLEVEIIDQGVHIQNSLEWEEATKSNRKWKEVHIHNMFRKRNNPDQDHHCDEDHHHDGLPAYSHQS